MPAIVATRRGSMSTVEELKRDADARRRDNESLAIAYSRTLSLLGPANLVLVVGAALLSLVAGASILTDTGMLNRVQSGVMALVSAGFTVIHSKLGCEQYQAECRKLLSFHRGIAADYANLSLIDDPDDLRKRLNALNDQASAILKSTSALPFKFHLAPAQRAR
jgi:hypothetical protein